MMRIALLACIGVALFATGCGGNLSTGSQPIGPAGAIRNPSAIGGPTALVRETNWHVRAGGSSDEQAFQGLDFFAGSITIDVGDSVTWTVGGNDHTVTFFGPLKKPRLPVTAPFGGHTYNGSEYTSSGSLSAIDNKYTVKFSKAGRFPYVCLFHGPEMAGVVIVQPRGTPYPHTQDYYTENGADELNRQLEIAENSIKQFPYSDDGTRLAAGIAPGLATGASSNSAVLRFLDEDKLDKSSITIRVGTTLTWSNQSNNEPHTVTFVPAGQQPPANPFAPPAGPPSYDGTVLVHSGPLFPGQSFNLKFTKEGTYPYSCLIHDNFGMVGTVIVHD